MQHVTIDAGSGPVARAARPADRIAQLGRRCLRRQASALADRAAAVPADRDPVASRQHTRPVCEINMATCHRGAGAAFSKRQDNAPLLGAERRCAMTLRRCTQRDSASTRCIGAPSSGILIGNLLHAHARFLLLRVGLRPAPCRRKRNFDGSTGRTVVGRAEASFSSGLSLPHRVIGLAVA